MRKPRLRKKCPAQGHASKQTTELRCEPRITRAVVPNFKSTNGPETGVPRIVTESKQAFCNTLQLRQTPWQSFHNTVKFWLFGQMDAIDYFPPWWVRLHRDTFGVISSHFKQYLFWRGKQAKPIVYIKCVRSQTSLITFILPAERKSFHLQAGRFYFRKSILLLWITPYLKKGNVPWESKCNMQGLCVWFRRP